MGSSLPSRSIQASDRETASRTALSWTIRAVAAGTGSIQIPASEEVILAVISWGMSHSMLTSEGSTPFPSSRWFKMCSGLAPLVLEGA